MPTAGSGGDRGAARGVGAGRRLDRLETVWRPPDADRLEAAPSWTLREAAKERAIRRYLREIVRSSGPLAWPGDPRWYDHPGHAHRPRRPDRPAFALVMGNQDDPAFAARADAELDELAALWARHAPDTALARWPAEPDDAGWPAPEHRTGPLAERFRRTWPVSRRSRRDDDARPARRPRNAVRVARLPGLPRLVPRARPRRHGRAQPAGGLPDLRAARAGDHAPDPGGRRLGGRVTTATRLARPEARFGAGTCPACGDRPAFAVVNHAPATSG